MVSFLPSYMHNPAQPFSISAYVFGDEMPEPRHVVCPDSELNYHQLELQARMAAGFVKRIVRP